ncbi:MAG: phenylalanine--tRNA ligase subunit beta [Candidatus Paceibacterota bacterium]
MLISYNLLKTYFDKEIPAPDRLAELFTFHSFEVDKVSEKNGGTLFDLKVLPDRAHYCLCHKGIAGELSAITGIPLQKHEYQNLKISKVKELSVKIEEPNLCRRYIGRRVENIKVYASPKWLKDFIEVLGGRSINNIVDATNFIMTDVGQPLHAFDADKVRGGITVRLAKAGEKITTLDGKNVVLDEKCLVIADEEGPLAIAGIKGGNRAEVDENTKNIILESANFQPSETRRTAGRVQILTEASKRFENELSPEVAMEGMVKLTELITGFESQWNNAEHTQIDAEKMRVGELVDIYPTKFPKTKIEVSLKEISGTLGIEIKEKEAVEILERMNIKVEKNKDNLELDIPYERIDLKIPEDIAEEVGRIYGYEKIPAKIPKSAKTEAKILPSWYYAEKIRDILVGQGFSEVLTYSFADKGELEVMSAATGKDFLRANLIGVESLSEKGIGVVNGAGLLKSMDLNQKNAPILGLEAIKIFEIGRVFTKNGEETHLALAVSDKRNKKNSTNILKQAVQNVKEVLNIKDLPDSVGDDYEIDIGKIISTLPEPTKWDIKPANLPDKKYQKISIYPFVPRDIAMFVPPEVKQEQAADLIKKSAGTDLLVVGPTLFDVFEKKGADGKIEKKSLAFHMVFQSQEKTLSDDEVNKIMDKVYKAISSLGWEIR